MKARNISIFLACIICLLSLWAVIKYFTFMADDGYIVLRYAENVKSYGEFAFNPGDRINALTSPLHGLIAISLSYISGPHILVVWKILMCLLTACTAFILAKKYVNNPPIFILPLILVLLSPFILMWTVGGLETPLILFFITALAIISSGEFNLRRFYLCCFVSGLIFITRYDSILFTFPFLVFFTIKLHNRLKYKTIFNGGLLYALLPVLWLSFSLWYYHDILPTSFYLKFSSTFNKASIIYLGQFLIYSGFVATFLITFWSISVSKNAGYFKRHFLNYAYMYAALFSFSVYGLMNANAHMMFGYRLYIPLLGVFIFLLLDILSKVPMHYFRYVRMVFYAVFIGLLISMQLLHINYVYSYSLGGYAIAGEFIEVGIKDFNNYNDLMREAARVIEKHINKQPKFEYRKAAIVTPAEGVVPYEIKDLYTYGDLVSLHKTKSGISENYTTHQVNIYARCSDYIFVGLPYQQKMLDSLLSENKYINIFDKEIKFGLKNKTRVLILYNSNPQERQFSPYARNLPEEIYNELLYRASFFN